MVIPMANPQLENGYTPIANEILDNILKYPLNGTQWRILMTVWRYTYGYSRKDHSLAIGFICKATGCYKRQIQRELDSLINANILIVTKEATFKSARRIAFNKNHETYTVERLNSSQVSNPTPVDDLDHSGANSHQVTNPTPIQVSNPTPIQVSNPTPIKTNIKSNIKTTRAMHADEFECFYSQHPNPKERQRTFSNWRKAIKEHNPDELIYAAQNYARTVKGTEKQYIKTSANFLGRDKPYLDYLYKPQVAPVKREVKPILFDPADPDAYEKLFGGGRDGH